MKSDAMVYAAFQAGACDYVQKTATSANMIQCVRDAYCDRSVMKPKVARKIRQNLRGLKIRRKVSHLQSLSDSAAHGYRSGYIECTA